MCLWGGGGGGGGGGVGGGRGGGVAGWPGRERLGTGWVTNREHLVEKDKNL